MSAQNVLFLSIEDLNDWIEPLGGHPDTRTPNLTRLARRAAVFTQAYSPAPACSPARTAALFGQYPWETGVYANPHKWHHHYASGQRLSLIGRMRDAGFETQGLGKVFHVNRPAFDHEDWDDFPLSNSELFPPISRLAKTGKFGPSIDFGPIPDGQILYDDRNTAAMIARMHPDARNQFWALGLYRPHLPFVVPQRFFDALPDKIHNAPGLNLNQFDANAQSPLSQLTGAARVFSDGRAQFRRVLHRTGEYTDFVKAYLASIHYADYLLGLVLDHMDACNLWENTLVVMWSDHGYQLGEKLAFHKFSLWERALRVPLMFAGPEIAPARIDTPVSLVDMAPTILAQMGQPRPEQFSGQDLSPLIAGETGAKTRFAACSSWGIDFNTDSPKIALSARSKRYRYTIYWDGNEELYDHRNDPFEQKNLIFDRQNHSRQAIDTLREQHQKELNFDLALPASPR
jgi:arylsulfatase A-like enzyme